MKYIHLANGTNLFQICIIRKHKRTQTSLIIHRMNRTRHLCACTMVGFQLADVKSDVALFDRLMVSMEHDQIQIVKHPSNTVLSSNVQCIRYGLRLVIPREQLLE
jgi:hypothetical protein